MTNEQQLIVDGLRDLHLPPAISGWPPAYGWWMLVAVLLVVIGCALGYLIKYRRQRDPRQQATTALRAAFAYWQADDNQANYLRHSHSILRQLAIDLAGRSNVSRLCGDQWVDWLEQQVDQPLPASARFALACGAYQREDIDSESIAQIHTAYVQWVNTVSKPARDFPDKGRRTLHSQSTLSKSDRYQSEDKLAIDQDNHA